MDTAKGSDAARVERSPEDLERLASIFEPAEKRELGSKIEAAELEAHDPAQNASYLVRVRLEPNPGAGKAPTLERLEGAIEAGLRPAFPDFTPHVSRAERLDRD